MRLLIFGIFIAVTVSLLLLHEQKKNRLSATAQSSIAPSLAQNAGPEAASNVASSASPQQQLADQSALILSGHPQAMGGTQDQHQPATAASARGAALTSRESFSLEKFRRAFPGNWEVSNLADGRPQTLAGGPIALPGTTSLAALKVAGQLAEQFGVAADEVAPSSAPAARSLARVALAYDQINQGIQVYQGRLTLIADLDSAATSLVMNDLKPITETESGPHLSASEAVREYLAGGGVPTPRSEILSTDGPFYYVEAGIAKPAWRAVVRSIGSELPLEVLIDGNSGKTLFHQPTGQM